MSGIENNDQFGTRGQADYTGSINDNRNLDMSTGARAGRGMGMDNDDFNNSNTFGSSQNPTTDTEFNDKNTSTGFNSGTGAGTITGTGMGMGGNNSNRDPALDSYGGGFTGSNDPMGDTTTGTSSGAGMGNRKLDDTYGTDGGHGDNFNPSNTGNEFDSTQTNMGSRDNEKFDNENQTGRKPGMGQKLKGTMDEMAGKLTGNKAQVEQGREMKSGNYSNA
ncbi:hypothetical protein DL93DRAFT_2102954 [Clavulina sp. PMI_390]|nr:hypothetical protein DL93DRAFT_2102954 [Clavulina sp. PMI_390]